MTPPVVAKSIKEHHQIIKEENKKWKKKNALKKLKTQTENKLEVKPKNEIIYQECSTISIALPGSILENAQSYELRTYLAGQIARAACIYQVDEIIVFDDSSSTFAKKSTIEDEFGLKVASKASTQLVRLLQYLECPQYLRKFLFPIHKDLKYAGILNPLEAPHHLRTNNTFQFREGIVTNKPTKPGRGSKVNVGLLRDVEVDLHLTPGIRCTVKLEQPENEDTKKLKGKVVSPATPRKETGVYWGYSVRLATSLSEIFSKSPYKDGYDLMIGTSDRGDSVDSFESPEFQHVLIMFGGLQGLEASLESDEKLKIDDPKLLFDFYLNTVPNQGSRTIRTEEAILVSLAELRTKLMMKNKPLKFIQHNEIACSEDPNVAINQPKNENDSIEDLSRFD